MILESQGIYDVTIQHIGGDLQITIILQTRF